jgi:hypothetical protein
MGGGEGESKNLKYIILVLFVVCRKYLSAFYPLSWSAPRAMKCVLCVTWPPPNALDLQVGMIVLCVAEKSSIAKSITQILSGGQYNTVSSPERVSPRTQKLIFCVEIDRPILMYQQ